MLPVALIAGSFLLGSIPFGLIVGRVARGVDVREHGSGNIGFTNVYRVLGPGPGALALIGDVGKGFAAVSIAKYFYPSPETVTVDAWVVVACALAVVAGHNWSVFLRFEGGKGVATGAGVLLALVPVLLVIMLAVWGVLVATTRYISLASIAAALLFPVLVLFAYPGNVPYLVLAIVGVSAVVYQHRGNIKRLVAGEERRITRKGATDRG